MNWANDVLELVGRTPLVQLRRLSENSEVKILAKIESKSIGGSIKDRVALAMVEAAEQSGELVPGSAVNKTIIEATSGNTGIGLAMVCAVKGYRLKLIMPESASEERKRIMRAYGAELVLTPGRLATDGAIEEAYRLAREEPEKYVLMDQYNNGASIQAHYRGTAREIWEQTDGQVTHVVATLGTSGTAMGLAKGLHEFNPAVRVIAVEPHAGHKIQGLKNMQESYPPGIYNKHSVDKIVRINDEDAFSAARAMAREEGLMVGMSSGAAAAVALQVGQKLKKGLVVFICPDGGERYLSTNLYASEKNQGVHLYNIRNNDKQVLLPANGSVGMFTPAPGLDNPQEAESWRRIVSLDVLCRYLKEEGVESKALAAVADMDDRTLAAARALDGERQIFVSSAMDELHDIARLLGVGPHVVFASCTDMQRSVDMVRALMDKGLAYEKLRSVYFDVARDKAYGEIARQDDVEGLQLGHTVDLDDYVKNNPMDFTLLKRATLQDLKLGEVVETRWGKVRPSWFTQLSAAAFEHLSGTDIVLAAANQRFPHLDNFASLFANAGRRSVQTWMVTGGIRTAGDEEHCPGVKELAVQAGGWAAVRLWLLSTSYRRPLTYSLESLSMWDRNVSKLNELYAGLLTGEFSEKPLSEISGKISDELRRGLREALEDDLGVYHFWPVLFGNVKKINALRSHDALGHEDAALLADTLRWVDTCLGMFNPCTLPLPRSQWPDELAEMVERRKTARRSKKFQEADSLRMSLAEMGFRVEDSPEGERVYAVHQEQEE